MRFVPSRPNPPDSLIVEYDDYPYTKVDIDQLLMNAPLGQNPYGMRISKQERVYNAKLIISRFLAAGHGLGVGLAAVVNADKESGLNARAGEGTAGVGLFQLTDPGAGSGLEDYEKVDPEVNISKILDVYLHKWNDHWEKNPVDDTSHYKESIEEALKRNAPLAEVAGLFSFHVERPNKNLDEYTNRITHAHYLFPSISNSKVKDLIVKEPSSAPVVPDPPPVPAKYAKGFWYRHGDTVLNVAGIVLFSSTLLYSMNYLVKKKKRTGRWF